MAKARAKTPKAEQTTKHQYQVGGSMSGLPLSIPGFSRAYTGIYNNYRLMASVPTVALCLAATKAVMKSSEWSVEADDDAPEDAVDLIQNSILIRQKARIMNDAVRCITFGNQPFEKVWKNDGGLWDFEKFVPMLPDLTTPGVDDFGNVVELKNLDVSLDPTKFVYLTYDAEAGNYFGRSRLENIRTTGHRAWMGTIDKFGQYMTKTAGAIGVVYHPPSGTGTTADGQVLDNSEIAGRLASRLTGGSIITMPMLYDSDTIAAMQNNPEFAKLMQWRIEFLNTGTDHSGAFLGGLKMAETQCVRGMYWPERALLEGQFGTKAEAGIHQDLAVQICYQDTQDIVDQLNTQAVDDLLEANYGPQMKGKVRLAASPLSDEASGFLREIVGGVLLDPNNADLFRSVVDFDAMMDSTGVPKLESTVDINPATNPAAAPVPTVVPPAPDDVGSMLSRIGRAVGLRRKARAGKT